MSIAPTGRFQALAQSGIDTRQNGEDKLEIEFKSLMKSSAYFDAIIEGFLDHGMVVGGRMNGIGHKILTSCYYDTIDRRLANMDPPTSIRIRGQQDPEEGGISRTHLVSKQMSIKGNGTLDEDGNLRRTELESNYEEEFDARTLDFTRMIRENPEAKALLGDVRPDELVEHFIMDVERTTMIVCHFVDDKGKVYTPNDMRRKSAKHDMSDEELFTSGPLTIDGRTFTPVFSEANFDKIDYVVFDKLTGKPKTFRTQFEFEVEPHTKPCSFSPIKYPIARKVYTGRSPDGVKENDVRIPVDIQHAAIESLKKESEGHVRSKLRILDFVLCLTSNDKPTRGFYELDLWKDRTYGSEEIEGEDGIMRKVTWTDILGTVPRLMGKIITPVPREDLKAGYWPSRDGPGS